MFAGGYAGADSWAQLQVPLERIAKSLRKKGSIVTRIKAPAFVFALGLAVSAAGCGDSSSPNPGSGGDSGTGGDSSSGGTPGDAGSPGSDGATAGLSGQGGDPSGTGGEGNLLPLITRRLAVADAHGCAITDSGSIECWGDGPEIPQTQRLQAAPPSGTNYDSLTLGTQFGCATAAGEVTCWGTAPAEPEIALAASAKSDSLCIIDTDGRPQCWSAGDTLSAVPNAFLADISVNTYSDACGVTLDGLLTCWGTETGENDAVDNDQEIPPPGAFTQISVGTYHSCAVTIDDAVVCWGAGDDPTATGEVNQGQAIAPDGAFTQVSAGYLRTCAIARGGQLECWGAGTTDSDCVVGWECGQAMPPPGTYLEVAAGISKTCAVRDDGHVLCWGSNSGGRSTPPDGLIVKLD